jgi:superfamily II DNA or RNA helicase
MSEVHSATISERYRFSRNFTFTASPEGRYDNADVKLEMMFGPIIFRLTYPEAVRLGLVVPIKIKWLSVQSTFNPAGEYSETVSRKRWGIWRNDFRNEMIANEAREYGDDQVLILVETVDHAVHLKQFLPEFEMCYADMDQDRLERYIRNKMLPEDYTPVDPERREAMTLAFETGQLKKVIATDVWGTGVDFEELAVLIRADARGSDILDTQYPGRVSRIVTSGVEKPYGLVIDCMDHFDKSFKRTSQSRSRNYKKKEWEQLGLSTARKRRSTCQS